MTPFTDIYDLAVMDIKDYKLDRLAENDFNSFLLYLEGILVRAIYSFEGSALQSLDYTTNESGDKVFVNELTGSEKIILADTMIINWFSKNVNDATQINLRLQGRDKKTNAESSNLKAKSEHLDRLREKLSQAINDYQLEGDNFMKIFG